MNVMTIVLVEKLCDLFARRMCNVYLVCVFVSQHSSVVLY